MSQLEISKMLTLSTTHLRASTCVKLEARSIDGVICYTKGDYGWFIWVPEPGIDRENNCPAPPRYLSDVPGELQVALEFGREHGCEWVCFDTDGETVEGLVIYEH